MIETLNAACVRLDYGPIQMEIQAVRGGRPLRKAAQAAARQAMVWLDELAQCKRIAALPQSQLPGTGSYPEILRIMVDAVRMSGDATLTPMAAVAGAFADMVADDLLSRGATKVIVNNGGDIAVRLVGDETATVGVAPALGASVVRVKQVTAGDGIGGITTSGLGGRSLTKGIATAATVAARTAALADACATSLGNATYAAHPNIQLVPAESIDPDIDIKGQYVVAGVGALPPEIIDKALRNGRVKAEKWYNEKRIKGAFLCIGRREVMVPDRFVSPL